MKQETRAILKVAGVFGSAALGSGVMVLALKYLTLQEISITLGVLTFGIFSKLMYDVALAQVKYDDKIKEMTKK